MINEPTNVLVTPMWSLQRPGQRALVVCDIALVQNEDDCGFYKVRITLNGKSVYTRVADSHEAVMADADGAVSDLLRVGWQLRGGDDGASVYDS